MFLQWWVKSAVLFLILLAGCSGTGGQSTVDIPDSQPTSPDQPLQSPVDFLNDLEPRTASLVFERSSDNLGPDQSRHVSIVNDAAWFIPYWESGLDDSGNLSYAVYRFATTESTQYGLQLDWQEAPADIADLWIGMANWDEQRWDWYAGQANGGIELAPTAYGQYVHPDTNELLVVVMLTGREPAGLCGISIAVDQRGAWPTYQHDPQRTGCSEYEGPQTADVKWTFETTGDGATLHNIQEGPDGTLYASAGYELLKLDTEGTILWRSGDRFTKSLSFQIASDGTIYLGDFKGVYALNSDHSIRWHYPAVCSSPLTLGPDSAVYFGIYGGLVALNSDGSNRWAYTTGDDVRTEPVLGPDGTVYFACWDNNLYALDPEGNLRWSYPIWQGVGDGPRVASDGTVLCHRTNSVIAVDPEGNLLWEYWTDDSPRFVGPQVAIDDVIYVGAGTEVLALNMDGTLKWTRELGERVSSRLNVGADGSVLAGTSNYVYFRDAEASLFALSSEGEVLWTHTTDNSVVSIDVIGAEGRIYAGGGQDKLYSLSSSGILQWTLSAGGPVNSSPVIAADGTVYFGCDDNRLYAVNSDGTLKWFYETEGFIRSTPAIGLDGMVYFGSCDNFVYAVDPSGDLSWKYETGQYIMESPVVADDGTVYISSRDGKLYSFSHDGELNWELGNGSDVYSTPAVAGDGMIYAASGHVKLNSFKPSGEVNWTAELSSMATMPVIASAGDIFVNTGELFRVSSSGNVLGTQQDFYSNLVDIPPCEAAPGRLLIVTAPSEDGMLCSVDLDGNQIWAYPTDSWPNSAPIADATGNAFIVHGWELTAIDPAGGEVWAHKTNGSFESSPAIGADGTLYIGNENGRLYAFGQ